MYAAIDEPGGIQGELYTSGSETYAQIQPPQMTVSVEINSSQNDNVTATTSHGPVPNGAVHTPLPPSIDSLKSHTHHSRQASASSCTSSLGYIGSPKPEKRQANSPLPPTPRSSHKSSVSTSGSNITSGRNSSASVIEVSGVVGIGSAAGIKPLSDPKIEKTSPSKHDVENMYAKVMKKSKLFSTASPANMSNNDLQNNNPDVFVSDPDIAKEINLPEFETVGASPGKNSTKSVQIFDNNYETIDKKRNRSSSFNNKDPGYETIPPQKGRNPNTAPAGKSERSNVFAQSRLSAPVDCEIGYESLPDQSLDPAYETLKRDSDYDPNYEVLRPSNASDDGYAKIQEKAVLRKSNEFNDGYSSIKSVRKNLDNDLGLYPLEVAHHGYAKIGDKRSMLNNNIIDDDGSDIYSSIPSTTNNPPYATIRETSSTSPGYSSIKDTRRHENGSVMTGESRSSLNQRVQQKLSECESLTGSDTDPNYETVRYLNVGENPYERLQSSPGGTPSPISVEHRSLTLTRSNDSKISDDSVNELSHNNKKDIDDYVHV